MKANNITVSIPNTGCEKNCPYCISKMTGYMKANVELWLDNLHQAKLFADKCNVTHLLITSKGEPLENLRSFDLVYRVCEIFKDYPIEIQTNGYPFMSQPQELAKELANSGIKVISISVDEPEYFKGLSYLSEIWYDDIKRWNMISRAAVILTDKFKGWNLKSFIKICKEKEINQITFRNLSIPERTVKTTESKKAIQYIFDHADKDLYDTIQNEVINTVLDGSGNVIMQLPFGPIIYDIDGIAVTCMEYCIQENNNQLNIRSLIYQEDGHLYTTWDKPGSILW
jgi:uncharacterized Fe-S cluster-containing radical SAM superfamily protein